MSTDLIHPIRDLKLTETPICRTVITPMIAVCLAHKKYNPWYTVSIESSKDKSYRITEWLSEGGKDIEIAKFITGSVDVALDALREEWRNGKEEAVAYIIGTSKEIPFLARCLTDALIHTKDAAARDKFLGYTIWFARIQALHEADMAAKEEEE